MAVDIELKLPDSSPADAWQIGSDAPPVVCLCCGSKFDNEKYKRRGPYLEMPYIWVCQWCWDKPYLFFPDKVFNRNSDTPIFDERLLTPKHGSDGGTMHLSIAPERTLKTRLSHKSVSKLKLDLNNPRYRHLGPFKTEEEMTKALWKETSTRTLYREIEAAQGLSNPMLVDSNMIVREGNRRLVCLRRLIDTIRAGESDVPLVKILKAPCFLLPANTKEEDIAMFLTLEHVTGKKEWRPVNQAAHVYDLHNVHGLEFSRIAEIIGRSQSALRSMERAYGATLEYHRLYPSDETWMGKYSYFFELFRHKRTSEWAGVKGNLERLSKWIHQGKISKGVEIRKLHLIIGNPETVDPALSQSQRESDRHFISLVHQTADIMKTLHALRDQGQLTTEALAAAESLNSDLSRFIRDSKTERE